MLTKFAKLCTFGRITFACACSNLAKPYSHKVPEKPIHVDSPKIARLLLLREEVALLERLSLVKCDTAAGVRVLEESIAFAEQVLHVPADGVDPMFTVLEHENLSLRQDKVIEGDCQKDVLRNASLTEEDYFVAPPGNIPLQDAAEPRDTDTLSNSKKQFNC